jgi:hypothetical protein
MAQGIGFAVGIKGGVAAGSYFGADYIAELGENALKPSAILGCTAGAFCTVDFSSVFSLQPEVLLVRTGNADIEEALFWGPYEGNVRYLDVLTYVAFPLLFKVRLGNIGLLLGADIRMRVGEAYSRLKASDETLQEVFQSMSLDWMLYSEDTFAQGVIAPVLGFEYQLPSRALGGEWSVEARITYALTNVLAESQQSFYSALGVGLLANYSFRLKKKPGR